jgi:soluble lytic murein transglycosylase
MSARRRQPAATSPGPRAAHWLLAPALALFTLTTFASDRLQAQRDAFRQALPHAERGQWKRVEPHLPLLADYVLYPELRSTWLRATVSSRSRGELQSFIDAHPDHPAARELMVRWLGVLASREDWPGYLDVYRQLGGSSGARLRCHAARARLATERVDDDWRAEALDLWHSGVSQPQACDPVFDRLRADGALTPEHIRARLNLAIEAREFGLATFLARSLADVDRERVRHWQAMSREPATRLREYPRDTGDDDEWQRVRYGLLVWGGREPEAAHARALELAAAYDGQTADSAEVLRRLALAAARRHSREAPELLDGLPEIVRDDGEVREWELRVALKRADWEHALRSARRQSGDEHRQAFWEARALEELGDEDGARQAFRRAAEGRSLYGFLAAERSRSNRPLRHRPTTPDPLLQQLLEARPAFVHARELFKVGQDSRGRSAWARAIANLDDDELVQAALLAHRWGWHSRAIATAARAGLHDDLELRYPLAWRESFDRMADLSRIPGSWAYSVARNESLFVPDIASHAGAVGLMQLMPATGREVASELQLPYRGLATLIDPETNLRLGTRYLENMLARFDANVVVATAAYNAGPGRVRGWLPEDGALPADVWIELIPFNETRHYVQQVLASKAIFHWRLTGEELELTPWLRPVGRPGG